MSVHCLAIRHSERLVRSAFPKKACKHLKRTAGSQLLQKNVELIRVAEIIGSFGEHHTVDTLNLTIRVYKLFSDSSSVDVNTGDDNADSDAAVARTYRMPSAHLEGLWESLYFDTDIKSMLLQFMSSAILFGEKGIDHNFISWNRLIFLHGPPGTGKTSLCRSLAQKIAIRMNHRYEYTKLVEINSHSLFSRYFSESGKLVGKTFEDFLEMLEDDDTFLVVLIDEVESLTTARTAAASGNDPSDSLRAVNALLTGLDKLKYKDNVIVLTTSNLPHTVDPAFLDRIDFKYYIGPPGAKSVYTILRSMFDEMIRCGIINHSVSSWCSLVFPSC
ncbi:P-loop containing nucleoside triphosphate hydrolase protein [Ascobolus immersus RN42]|uniref:P-loop containing nucleoside triphosphate hydrolase protein n=1 Tax=Ascobolus immersus RN42 TaxID=1160509 RepID=A0A3N4HQX3_ASCIM|nr:P-loop containing nucleoside triphosphate hydrolase protein [Ascobolus immersus RN42]